MAFLVVAGITIRVAVSSATEQASEDVGSDSRAFAGNLRTTVRVENRVWKFSAANMTDAQYAAFRAAIALGVHVACSGDALGAAFTCRVKIDTANIVKIRGSQRRNVSFTVRQVS